jgi:hypothetical protein
MLRFIAIRVPVCRGTYTRPRRLVLPNCVRSSKCCFSISPAPKSEVDTVEQHDGAHPDVRWTIPNAMTILRLFLGPVSGGLIVTGHFPEAFGALFFAGFLDWADGAWARAFNSQSLLGSFIDPLADKASQIIYSLNQNSSYA